MYVISEKINLNQYFLGKIFEYGWKSLNDSQKEEVFAVSKRYMDFLNVSKTER